MESLINQRAKILLLFRGERNFHVFYYMYDGLEADNRLSEFYLDPTRRRYHRYLTHYSHTSQTHIDKFQQLKMGFKVLGFHDSEVDTVYRVLAAILHLGDIEFAEVASQDNTDNKSRVIDTIPLHRGEISFASLSSRCRLYFINYDTIIRI